MVDKNKLIDLISKVDNDAEIANELSKEIVIKYTQDLDSIMIEINQNIVVQDDIPDVVLQRYLMELSNAYYFIAAKCESSGIWDDIAKANATTKYNDVYSDTQLKASMEGKKMTVADLTAAAQQGSLEENLVSQIYSRSCKAIKAKLAAAQTQIDTLGKILKSHNIERQMSGLGTM